MKTKPLIENAKPFSTYIPECVYESGLELKTIDFRSDTVSTPCNEMKNFMFEAEVGDAVFNEDPNKNALEKKAAELFEMEDACLVTSGTMANLAAIIVHCNARNSEIIVGSKSHIMLYEQVGAAQYAGANVREVENNPDGTFSLAEMKKKIRRSELYEPYTRLICVENTHNCCGGKVLPLEWLDEIVEFANDEDIPLHMDGARIFNASIKLKVPVSRLVRGFASVNFCLSKGLGCPYGAILLGSKEFITQVRRVVKGLGGGSRQIGYMAAAGIYALDNKVNRLKDDHDMIQSIADAIRESNSPYMKVLPAEEIHTNILMIYLDDSKITSAELLRKLLTVSKEEKFEIIIKAMSMDERTVRLVSHCSISKADTPDVIAKLRHVINTI